MLKEFKDTSVSRSNLCIINTSIKFGFQPIKFGFQPNFFLEIIKQKDNTSYSKKIQINKNNIIINGELNENSKITKIEYRNIQGTQRILFDHKGPIEKSDIDGEIKITIDQDPKQEELKQIFESKN